MQRKSSKRLSAGAAARVEAAWDRQARVQPGKSGLSLLQVLLWEGAKRAAAGRQRLRSGSLFQQMPGGWGARRRGLEQGLYPAPCTPAHGTALKSCGVCHRPVSPRMRIRKVEFPPPPPSLSLFSSLWFCNLKKNFFFFSSPRTPGERSPEREGESAAVGQEGRGWVGGTRSRRSVSRLRGSGSRGRLLRAPRRRLRRPESGSARPPPSELLPPPPPPGPRPPAALPARSPAPRARAPNEEVGSPAGHGPPELNSRRGAPRPSPAPRPRCPRFASPFALERRGNEGD